jgi:hypothetical protein
VVSERELVGLLYRADWTKLSLSGTVTGSEPAVETVITVRSSEPPSGLWQREDEDGEDGEGAECALSVAPGARFRAQGADGAWALGCDGERMWHWFRDPVAGTSVSFGLTGDDRPRPPYQSLLAPSWLLTDYSLLVVDGEVTVGGRAGVRVLGTPRKVTEPPHRFGGRLGRDAGAPRLFAPPARWLHGQHWDEVEAVVDAELGILLRCAKRPGDRTPAVTEFASLNVGEPADASLFTMPAGGTYGGRGPGERAAKPAGTPAGASLGDAMREAAGEAGKEAAKAVAGMAAGGLGALIKYGPKGRRVDPFTQAASEAADPEAAMPTDERPPEEPAGGPEAEALTDEVLHLVYRSGLGAPSLRATLHEWADFDALLAAVPRSARGTGFGGVGFLVDAMRDATRDAAADTLHAESTVAMGGWSEYRIDVVRSMGNGHLFPRTQSARRKERDVARTIVSDGARQWKVYGDQVIAGPAAPPPSDLADLVDAAWLLDRDLGLSGGTEVWVGGRRAYRIVARYRDVGRLGMGWWQRLFFPAVALVDAETGLLLRLTRFKGGRPAMRQELRDLTSPEPGAGFRFTPPDGLPVVDPEADLGEGRPGTRTWSWNPPR